MSIAKFLGLGRFNESGIPAPSDGDLVELQVDEFGRLKVVAATSATTALSGDANGAANANTVTKIRNTTVPTWTGADAGKCLTVNGGAGLEWDVPAVSSVTMGGDASGSSASCTVNKIKNRSIIITSPVDGEALVFSGGNLVNGAPDTGSTTLGGDVTGASGANTVAKLQTKTLTITTPASKHVLQYDGSKWVNGAVTSVDGVTFNFGDSGPPTTGKGIVYDSTFHGGAFKIATLPRSLVDQQQAAWTDTWNTNKVSLGGDTGWHSIVDSEIKLTLEVGDIVDLHGEVHLVPQEASSNLSYSALFVHYSYVDGDLVTTDLALSETVHGTKNNETAHIQHSLSTRFVCTHAAEHKFTIRVKCAVTIDCNSPMTLVGTQFRP